MSQQLAIIVLVDVGSALRAKTLKGNTYLFDNMRLQGSQNEGSGDLVTAVNGAHWVDGSQASEQVLNWLPYSLGSIPPTVPRNYHALRSHRSDQQVLEALGGLASAPEGAQAETLTEVKKLRHATGTRVKAHGGGRSHARAGHKVLDVTGHVVAADAVGDAAHAAPVITDIFGEAVDKKIIYPAQYGSPDLVTDGWYWSASVDTSRPGVYSYSMRVELHELTRRDGELVWSPVRLTAESRLKVTSSPRHNGFTGAGVGLLPIGWPAPPPDPAAEAGTPADYGYPGQPLAAASPSQTGSIG